MKIIINSPHLAVTEALDQHIQKKFSLLTSHHHDISNIEITLIIENKQSKAEASVHIPGDNIFASSDNGDMYVAIDTLIPKLEKQLNKHKEKIQNR